MTSAWFTELSRDDDDIREFMAASSLRRQARRFEGRGFAVTEDWRRLEIGARGLMHSARLNSLDWSFAGLDLDIPSRASRAAFTSLRDGPCAEQPHHRLNSVHTRGRECRRPSLNEFQNFTAPKELGRPVASERVSKLEVENASLRKDLDAARAREEKLQKAHKEQLELLEIQVRAYRDDFTAEKRDREKAVGEKESAECRIKELEAILEQLQLSIRRERDITQLQLRESSSAPVVSNYTLFNEGPTFTTYVRLPCSASASTQLVGDTGSVSSSRRTSSSGTSTTPITVGFERGLASVQSFTVPSELDCESASDASTVHRSCLQIDTSAPADCPALPPDPEESAQIAEYERQQSPDTQGWSRKEPAQRRGSCGESLPDKNTEPKVRRQPEIHHLPLKAPGPHKVMSPLQTDDGTLTQTMEEVICPRCERVFPPDQHIQFLDHFENCHAR